MAVEDVISSSLGDNGLLKVAMFFLVQALVYIILSNSSDIFSKTSTLRSTSSDRLSLPQLRYLIPDGEGPKED
uniref:Uncharacterized protein n=1 Tax=Kalanchoe fedtschenkoi TaxID=63787 RepID=A0A7N0V5Z9_KALFE